MPERVACSAINLVKWVSTSLPGPDMHRKIIQEVSYSTSLLSAAAAPPPPPPEQVTPGGPDNVTPGGPDHVTPGGPAGPTPTGPGGDFNSNPAAVYPYQTGFIPLPGRSGQPGSSTGTDLLENHYLQVCYSAKLVYLWLGSPA